MNPSRLRAACAALPLLCSCGTGAPIAAAGLQPAESGAWPLVVLVLEEAPEPHPSIPWSLTEGRERVSVGMVAPGRADPPIDPVEEFLLEALDAGMLVALVEAGTLPGDLSREHIQIWSDSGGNAASIPGEIAASIPDSSWSVPIRRHMLLREIFDLYLPDLAVIRLRDGDPDELRRIARFWTDPEILSTRNLILYAPSRGPELRGWVLIGGPPVNGETPLGMSPGGLLATMEFLAGLDWESAIPSRIPAVGILTATAGEPGS